MMLLWFIGASNCCSWCQWWQPSILDLCSSSCNRTNFATNSHSHNHCQQQQQPSFSNTHNIDLPIQKWHTVAVVVSTHKVQSTCKEEFIGYCTQRFAVSCNVLSCTPCRSKSDGPHDMHTQTTTTMTLPLLLLWFLHAQLSLRERERRGCVTSVHGKRSLEVVDVSTSWANEGSKFQGRPWDA